MRAETQVKFEAFSIFMPNKYNCEQIMDKVNDRGKQSSTKKGEMTNRNKKEEKKEEESKMGKSKVTPTGIEQPSVINDSDSRDKNEEKIAVKEQHKVESKIGQNETNPGINQSDALQRRNGSKVILVQNRRKQRYINAGQGTKSQSRLTEIEKEKQNILSELGKLDQQITLISKNQADGNYSNFRDKLIDEEQARRKARSLIRQLKRQKEELQERKRRMFQKSLQLVKQEEEESRRQREMMQARLKEEKKRAIEERMEEQRRKREERISIDKESNKLIMQLKKEDEILKKREDTPIDLFEYEKRKKSLQKKGELNFKQIEEHEKKYLFNKQNEKKKERVHTVSYPIQKYEKNIWAERLEEEQFKAKQQEKIEQQNRRERFQKKMKYSELIKKMYSPKKMKTVKSDVQGQGNNRSRSILPRITQSDKKMSEGKAIKQFVQQYRASLTTKANHKKLMKEENRAITQQNQDDEVDKKVRRIRQFQLRKQTKQRLKKLQNQLQNQSLDLKPPSKPKYQNYLGQLKTKNRNHLASMKKILQSSNLSKQQKYDQMLKMAAQIQSKARVIQESHEGDQSATKLYIGSIQAKIALLEQF